MQSDLAGFLVLARETVQDPRGTARRLMDLQLPEAVGPVALGLMAVLSALLSSLALRMTPIEAEPVLQELFSSPLRMVLVQGVALLVTVMMVHGVGRIFGGKGQLVDAVLLIAWIEVVLLLVQTAQIVLLLIAPPLSDLAGVVAIVLFFWLLSNFIAELHGFRSALMVLFCMFGTVLVVSLALAIVAVYVVGVGV